MNSIISKEIVNDESLTIVMVDFRGKVHTHRECKIVHYESDDDIYHLENDAAPFGVRKSPAFKEMEKARDHWHEMAQIVVQEKMLLQGQIIELKEKLNVLLNETRKE